MNLVALQSDEGYDVWIYPGNVFLIRPALLQVERSVDWTVVGSFVSFTDSTGRHESCIRVSMTPSEVVGVLCP